MIGLPVDVSLGAAFVVGLLGSVHCLGMCSGIVGAFGAAVPDGRSRSVLLIAYNGGRIASYAIVGAMAGLLGAGVLGVLPVQWVPALGAVIAAAFLVALGLYLAGWWQGLVHLERYGAHLWRRIAPLGRRLLPATTPVRAWFLGMIWGWLPCGLVYAVAVWSMTAGRPVQGAAMMAAFGLGTLPAMVLVGTAGARLAAWRSRPRVRQGAGAVLVALGAVGLVAAMVGQGHLH